MTEFQKWDKEFRENNLNVFNNNPKGLLWLKVKAISRGKQIKEFTQLNHIHLNSSKIADQHIELFNILEKIPDAQEILNQYLLELSHEWYRQMGVDTPQLKEDLYSIKYYHWGGDQNNSLDKYLVSHYVKVISKYKELWAKQSEIGFNAWNYVQNSWYNNWTSFLIESIFKRNPNVIPAVGEIKNVDFFISDYPIDLKVTYFPNKFMEQKMKAILGKKPLTWLKQKCKKLGITCDPSTSENQQLYSLSEKLKEQGGNDVLEQFINTQSSIIQKAQEQPLELMKWLYEHQGEMRFGAENRLYLILVDSSDLSQSWKMKRAFSLIEPKIKAYIDNFNQTTLQEITFEYKKKKYTALSDTLFIMK